jgi:uncharacterized heparinase superfamily protein
MLNLKSIYFYFLATKIYFIKIIKKAYFTTNFYNNSLKSKIPQKIHFYPNPFLLSSFTNNKNFSFKVSNIDADIFWDEQIKKEDERNLQNFFWLNLVNRKNEGNIIQKIITVWIYKNNKYKKVVWENSILSKRIISWILNSDIILNYTNEIFKKDFFQSIILQVNHLKKNTSFENDHEIKIEIICAILLSGLVFKEYKTNYDHAIKDLEKFVAQNFDKQGFPINRNPGHLIKYSKYLLLIKECINDAHEYVPDFLKEIIDKNLNCLKSITTSLNQLPLFNGATEIDLENYYEYIERLNYKIKKPSLNVGKIQIIKNKKDSIYFDVGQAPKKDFSSSYQSGPLSLEYFVDRDKIITNCGFGSNISSKAKLLSRLTSAQSTLCLNDTSVTKFERNRIINKAFGNSIKDNFKVFDFYYKEDINNIISSSTHNAYEKTAGYLHKRTINLSKIDNIILGTDELIRKNHSGRVKFNIRFHLVPGITAVKTMGGESVLIQIKKNKSLVFKSQDQNISVEKSIFLGGNKILNNLCINISGYIINDNVRINWEIKKNI